METIVLPRPTDHPERDQGIRGRLTRMARAAVAAALAPMFAAPASSAVPAPAVPVLHWHSCDGRFQCAVAKVPLDYQHPDGATIDLSVIRSLATDPAQSLGSLFINGGGPQPQVDSLPSTYATFPAALRARYDLITFDPRGLGMSTPVRCFRSSAAEQGLLSQLPPYFPVGAGEGATWERIWAAFDAQCAAHGGPLLDHDTTADEARDMNLLREAVGDPVLNYFAISYGTLLGATYANLFPDTVGRMILDGNVNAAGWTNASGQLPSWLRLGLDTASAAVLDDFLDLCGSTSTARCAFSAGSPGATRARFATLLDRLQEHPVTVGPPPQTWTYAATVSFLPLSIVAQWQQGAQQLQEIWLASSSPAGSSMGVSLERYQDEEQKLAILCADAPNPSDPAAYPVIAKQAAARAGGFGLMFAWQAEGCAKWPAAAAQDRYAGPWNRATSGTILLIGNTGDPGTSYQSSVALSHELARARLLTVAGYGHTEAGNPSICALAYEIRYVLSGSLPAKGTVCQQGIVPFPVLPGNQ
jgi:pimeloyl-ACP methyl ester carboxylesterase